MTPQEKPLAHSKFVPGELKLSRIFKGFFWTVNLVSVPRQLPAEPGELPKLGLVILRTMTKIQHDT